MTVGVRVFCPETKLPPTVVQTNAKDGPEEEPPAFKLVCGNAQFNWAGGAMTVVGGGCSTTTTLVLVGQILAPLTVTE